MAKAARKTDTSITQTRSFDAEIASVLHVMIHALYTNRDIFLRELISNASDACDKRRFEAQSNASLGGEGELGITIAYDKKAKTITIADSGIGMDDDDLVANLGTIARSGTKEYLERLSADSKNAANLIGQFGVGFYSAFMVADSVQVHTRKAGEDAAWQWESDGKTGYSITEGAPRDAGTTITLHLKDDAQDYLDIHKLSHIVKTYSDHISFPIEITDDEGVKRRVNEASAIWMRAKSDVTPEQYQEFYRHIAHSPEEPFMVLHNKNEGALEYANLLFIPGMKPFDLFHPERRRRVKLYVKRVYITDEGIELIPAYLRFLRGVIDSADLPLNISRETLQKNALLDKIRDSITSKVLGELKKKAEKEPEAYAKFWENFGPVLKEGLCESVGPREKILDACRFYSTHDTSTTTSLEGYISRMKDGQKAIYFLTGDSVAALSQSPQIEGFKARGIEVLLLTDHVDDFWTSVTLQYKEHPFKSVIRSGEELEQFAKPEDATNDAAAKTPAIDGLIAAMKTLYGDEIRDVRITKKLAESPCCLAISDGDMDMRMERFLMEHNQLPKRQPKILEINASHPLIIKCADIAVQGVDDGLKDTLWLLLDQARIAEGEPLTDAHAFIQRLNAQLIK